MVKNIIILFIAFYFITLQVPVYASGWNFRSGHFAVKHNEFSRHKSNHTSRSFVKHKLKFHRKWDHKTKGTNRIALPYYIYYPHYASYGTEEEQYVQITVIYEKNQSNICMPFSFILGNRQVLGERGDQLLLLVKSDA